MNTKSCCPVFFDPRKSWPTKLPIGPRLPALPNATNGLRGPGGYSDVVLHEHEGKDYAAVVFEYSDPSSCEVKLAMVDTDLLLPHATEGGYTGGTAHH